MNRVRLICLANSVKPGGVDREASTLGADRPSFNTRSVESRSVASALVGNRYFHIVATNDSRDSSAESVAMLGATAAAAKPAAMRKAEAASESATPQRSTARPIRKFPAAKPIMVSV